MGAPDPLRARRLERRVLGGIVAAALLLMLIGVHWGLPNVDSWNGDDIAPDKPLRVLHDWWRGSHKYPYLHWWLNLPLYLPWLTVVAALGQVDLGCLPRLRPGCFDDPWRDMTVFILLSRLLSVAMGVGIVLGTRRLALALHGDRAAALLAAAIAAGSPVLVFFGHTSNLDVPVTFWFTLSLVAGVALVRRGAAADYLRFGVLAACAIATKDPILGAYALPALALAGVHFARVRGEEGGAAGTVAVLRRAASDRRLLLLIGGFAGVYVVVQNAILNFDGFVAHWRFWLVEGSPVYEALRAQTHDASQTPRRLFRVFEALLGAPMWAFCGLAALYALAVSRPARALGLPALSYLAISVLPTFLAPRLALPLLPVFAVWGGMLASRLLRAPAAARLPAAAVLAVAFLFEYGAALHLDLRMLGDSRYEAESWVAEHVPREERIAGLGAPPFLPRVERMGYRVTWHAIDSIRRGTLEEDGARWALLNPGSYPGADRAYLDDLRAGRLGYEVAYLAQGREKPLPWLDGFRAPGSVSPPVYVLRRREGARRRDGESP